MTLNCLLPDLDPGWLLGGQGTVGSVSVNEVRLDVLLVRSHLTVVSDQEQLQEFLPLEQSRALGPYREQVTLAGHCTVTMVTMVITVVSVCNYLLLWLSMIFRNGTVPIFSFQSNTILQYLLSTNTILQ